MKLKELVGLIDLDNSPVYLFRENSMCYGGETDGATDTTGMELMLRYVTNPEELEPYFHRNIVEIFHYYSTYEEGYIGVCVSTTPEDEIYEREQREKKIAKYFSMDYGVKISRSPKSSVYVVSIPKLSGCRVENENLEQALKNIGYEKEKWIRNAVESGKEVPEP